MNSRFAPLLGSVLAAIAAATLSAETVWLDGLNLAAAAQGWGQPHANQSVAGKPLTLAGKSFAHGFGTHANSMLCLALDGRVRSFSACVGVDDEVGGNPAARVEFIVTGDGKTLWKSDRMRAGAAAQPCTVDLAGVHSLVLQVSDAGNGIDFDHADWADAQFEIAGAKPVAVSRQSTLPPTARYILTPAAPPAPRLNGAMVFGVRPGSPFLYRIPATGDRPLKFSAKNLPRGLKLDSKTGIIAGALKARGEFTVRLMAKNSLGTAEKTFRIVCGDRIALTPPMGWNSWNCFARAVSAEKVRSAADALVQSGLIHHGWAYINVDDYWQNHRDSKDPTLQGPFRNAQGDIVPNSRFPDMKGLADYIHHLGLKAGLYSSPGPWTCGGCAGSYEHELQDAEIYAKWGFDYLKYDWCSYGSVASGKITNTLAIPLWGKTATNAAGAIYPYHIMGDYLRRQNRDIVFSLCQYGMMDVWKWGDSVNGNCWRTTGDITDTWRSMSRIGFHQDEAEPFARPGNWNDPDMLVVGQVGWGKPHPSRLTPDEQYTHISLWCLLSAPLLIGCDLTQMDDFTLNLLSNDEVLAIDQDALGKSARCVWAQGDLRIFEKELEDGGHALGFFNLGPAPAIRDFNEFASLGFVGKQHVRDLWRQINLPDLDAASGSVTLAIPAHGVALYKLTAAK